MNPILVVGAKGGVGSAVVAQLVAAGRRVIATVRRAEDAADVRAASPGVADVIVVDLADGDATRRILDAYCADLSLAGVIVCAARGGYGPLETSALDEFRAKLEINVVSHLAIFQACLPALRRAKGRLVLVSSYSGKVALPFLGQYKASKFALEGLADVMRMEAAQFGVRVLVVEPGGIATEMSHGMARSIDADTAALSAEEEALYGQFYRAFGRLLKEAHDMPSGADVAAVIIAAFDAEDPDPRYPYGNDTAWLLEQKHTLSDREMDALAMQIYGLG